MIHCNLDGYIWFQLQFLKITGPGVLRCQSNACLVLNLVYESCYFTFAVLMFSANYEWFISYSNICGKPEDTIGCPLNMRFLSKFMCSELATISFIRLGCNAYKVLLFSKWKSGFNPYRVVLGFK